MAPCSVSAVFLLQRAMAKPAAKAAPKEAPKAAAPKAAAPTAPKPEKPAAPKLEKNYVRGPLTPQEQKEQSEMQELKALLFPETPPAKAEKPMRTASWRGPL